MESCKIKNLVFDVGNVIVRWSPIEIIRLSFSATEDSEQLAKSVFQSDIWADLNKGLMSESEAKIKFQAKFGFTSKKSEQLFYYIKHTQLLIFGSVDLLRKVKCAGYNLYALTDNVIEIVEYLKSAYDFWQLFDGTIVSAEVGYLKPQPEIFNRLLSQYEISATETVFIDDMSYNIKGAESIGFSGILFENAAQCESELKSLGLSF